MRMPPGLRNFMLALHIAVSVGWMGAVAAYLVLDLTTATSQEPATRQAAWTGMALIVNTVIVPLALAALISGIIQSLGTKWGLFRHWWVLISLILTLFATLVLLSEAGQVSRIAELAASQPRPGAGTLLHSIGGLLVLAVITVLNVYKPQGLTRYGWRKQQEERRKRSAWSGEGRL